MSLIAIIIAGIIGFSIKISEYNNIEANVRIVKEPKTKKTVKVKMLK